MEAIARNADAGDHQHVVGLVELGVGAAFDEARIADQADDFGVVDELRGHLRGGLRIPLVVLDAVMDRTAVDAAVRIHASEISGGGLRRAAEVGRPGLADHGADLDRLAGRGLAVAQTAFWFGGASAACRRQRHGGADDGPGKHQCYSHHFPPLY